MQLNQQPVERSVNVENMLEIVKVWETIQGEGPYVGFPAIFVRLAGCNYQCPNCFGVGVKGRIPYLSRSWGPKVRLDKVREGEVILTFDEDFQMVETTVKEVLRRTVKRWLEIRIAGRTYDVTPEHPFFTNRGLVCASDLEIGDEILEARPEEIISFKKLGDRNPIHDPEVMERKLASTDYDAVGKKIGKTRRKRIASGEITFPPMSDELRARFSEERRREGNPNWKGKNPNLLDVQEEMKSRKIVRCQKCGKKKKKLLIHHLDENHDNDSRENLAVWCHLCHNRYHERGYNFWNGNRKDGKELIHKHNGQTVQKIKRCRGKLGVVNISCSPHNTYLANGMWVHNCDTDYTSNREWVSTAELMQRIHEIRPAYVNNRQTLVVLTGGEPFRQNFIPFARAAIEDYYLVQVETNGSLYRDVRADVVESVLGASEQKILIVCSPKGKVNPKMWDQIAALKYVVAHDDVAADGLPKHTLGNPFGVDRPPSNWSGPIYIQPMDEQDEERNKLHLKQAVKVCMEHNYLLCLQMHKIAGLE